MKKIGIVYGHVASNMGDLALNTGIAALLADVAPDAAVHAVFLDPNPKYLQNAIDSFAPARAFTYTALPIAQNSRDHSAVEKDSDVLVQSLHFLTADRDFLAEAGLSDCDAILYNSGEHLFSHPDNENIADLLCRMLPFVAAQRAGIPLIILPSTFGPFTPGVALDIVNLLTGSATAVAARDAQSFKVLQELYPAQDKLSLHLDPAFFIPATRKAAPAELRHLGIAMRQENFGLRLGKTLSALHSAARREDGFKTTLAYQFSHLLATKFLADKQNKITFFIQTLADRNLTLKLQEDLTAEGFGAQIDVQYPQTVAAHQAALASVDAVVASRFHACILSLAQGVPAIGIHFEQHGHKMRGLFDMLGIPDHCQTLSAHHLDCTTDKTLALLATPADAFLPVLERRMQETRQWLRTALQQPARTTAAASENDVLRIGLAAYTRTIEKTMLRLQNDNNQLRQSLAHAQGLIKKHPQQSAYRLGRALLDARKSWQGLRRLPGTLWDIRRTAQEKRRNKNPRHRLSPPGPHRLFREGGLSAVLLFGLRGNLFSRAYQKNGLDGLQRVLDACQNRGDKRFQSYCLTRASETALQHHEKPEALRYARQALNTQATRRSLTLLIEAALCNAAFDEAAKAAEQLCQLAQNPVFAETQAMARTQAFSYLLDEAKRTTPVKPVGNTIANRAVYFLHSSLPYASGGYATRAHGIACALHTEGIDVKPVTRPRFPFDATGFSEDTDSLPHSHIIDNIPYQRIDGSVNRADDASEALYMRDCAEKFEEILRKERPAVVHGRSTYLIALPALIAARRCGIPFVYEISGLWEIVHESRADAQNKKHDTDMMRLLEKITAENADHVFTLTEAMRQEMISRGVPPEKITLTPNCVAPEKFVPCDKDETRAAALNIPKDIPVIGYIGSFVDYEGLEDLVESCAALAQKGLDFRLLLVGDGAEWGNIQNAVAKNGIQDKTILTGRVPHDDVKSYYSLIDICPFPRKAWPVCEMVSPMKPLEAMAMGKTILVSNVAALAEMVTDNVTGCVFEKSNTADLTHRLEALLQNETLRQTIGRAARDWVVQNRNWKTVATHIIKNYKTVTNKKNSSNALRQDAA